MPENISKDNQSIVASLNRTYSERYVKKNNDLGYLEYFWNLSVDQTKYLYLNDRVSSPMPSWDSVEDLVQDKYLELFSQSPVKDDFEKRVTVLMDVYSLLIPYFYAMVNDDPSVIGDDFLNLFNS